MSAEETILVEALRKVLADPMRFVGSGYRSNLSTFRREFANVSSNWMSMLHISAFFGRGDVCEHLIRARLMDPNLKTVPQGTSAASQKTAGKTPLHFACQQYQKHLRSRRRDTKAQYIHCIETLLKFGAVAKSDAAGTIPKIPRECANVVPETASTIRSAGDGLTIPQSPIWISPALDDVPLLTPIDETEGEGEGEGGGEGEGEGEREAGLVHVSPEANPSPQFAYLEEIENFGIPGHESEEIAELDKLASSLKSALCSEILPIQEELNRARKRAGEERFGRFQIQNEELTNFQQIGEGGFGKIFLAVWMGSGGGSEVVVKTIETAGEDPRHELESISLLNHPNVVKIFGYVKLKKEVRIVMERMQMNLDKVLEDHESYPKYNQFSVEPKDTPLSLTQKYSLLMQLSQSIAYLHNVRLLNKKNPGIIHRDIKPNNFLINDLGDGAFQVKVCDFGLARLKDNSETYVKSMTQRGVAAYRAPELFQVTTGGLKYRWESDVYSLGCVFWNVMESTCSLPFVHNPHKFRIRDGDDLKEDDVDIDGWFDGYMRAGKQVIPKKEVLDWPQGMADFVVDRMLRREPKTPLNSENPIARRAHIDEVLGWLQTNRDGFFQ